MFNSIVATTLSPMGILICSIFSLVMGAVIALAYMQTGKFSRNFPIALVLLPVMVQMVIMMVNGNLGAGVAVAGTFSLVRFRSLPGSSKEIVSIFFAMAVGIANGMGFIGYGTVFAIGISLLMVTLYHTGFAMKNVEEKTLRITIPEELDYTEVFQDVFQNFTQGATLERVKTTNLGSMFELSYLVKVDDVKMEKQLMDEIRIRNANLPVLLNRVAMDPANEL